MSVRKRFFVNEIANKIKHDLINLNNDLDFLKTVSIGNIDLMPSPEELNYRETAIQFLPAVYIMPDDVSNITATPNKSISSGSYSFIMRYVHYYDKEDTTSVMSDAIAGAELVAETLLEDHNLIPMDHGTEYVELLDKDNTPIGHILQTDVTRIVFDVADTEIFKQLRIPVVLVDIEYNVTFRSLYVKGV